MSNSIYFQLQINQVISFRSPGQIESAKNRNGYDLYCLLITCIEKWQKRLCIWLFLNYCCLKTTDMTVLSCFSNNLKHRNDCFFALFYIVIKHNQKWLCFFAMFNDFHWNMRDIIVLFCFLIIWIPSSSDWRFWLQPLQSDLDGIQIIKKATSHSRFCDV